MTSCLDCAAQADADNHPTHEPTCPLAGAIEKVTAADVDWFERHPSTDAYRRPIDKAEVEELRHLGLIPAGCEVRGRVFVRQLALGARTPSLR
jgi:hypothetical protein